MRGAIMVALTVFAAQAAVAQTENFDNNQAGVTGPA
jgi:hypothetical protein